jgi:hypothetical protein
MTVWKVVVVTCSGRRCWALHSTKRLLASLDRGVGLDPAGCCGVANGDEAPATCVVSVLLQDLVNVGAG